MITIFVLSVYLDLQFFCCIKQSRVANAAPCEKPKMPSKGPNF